MDAIVTVTDGNNVNQTALKILIKGLLLNIPYKVDIYVLSPPRVLTKNVVTWLNLQKIALRTYPLAQNGDAYQVKFLLGHFLLENPDFENILYLDPDHIVLGNVFEALRQIPGILNVSSEVSVINSDALMGLPEIDSEKVHYNTSLVYGHRRDWLAILDNWASRYARIDTFIPNRFREEIAFSLAAKPSGINLIPVSRVTQTGFHDPHTDCILFHYGGEFSEAKRIKNALRSEGAALTKLHELLYSHINEIEYWVVNEIINNYKEQE